MYFWGASLGSTATAFSNCVMDSGYLPASNNLIPLSYGSDHRLLFCAYADVLATTSTAATRDQSLMNSPILATVSPFSEPDRRREDELLAEHVCSIDLRMRAERNARAGRAARFVLARSEVVLRVQ